MYELRVDFSRFNDGEKRLRSLHSEKSPKQKPCKGKRVKDAEMPIREEYS